MKRCKNDTCPHGVEPRDYSEFYQHPRMADGHLNECKTCTKDRMKRTRVEHSDHYAQYERDRDRVKVNARRKLRNAVASGSIIKTPCVICGNEKSQGHHEDYSKPLDVIWMCNRCHAEHHSGFIDATKVTSVSA